MITLGKLLAWIAGSVFSAELLGYGLHRLLHSGAIGFLSRNHMKHHLLLYGPLQEQRSAAYQDATDDAVSLGNIGVEWLAPAAGLIATVALVFYALRVPWLFQLIYFATTLGWSFLMFSYLHDVMHVDGIWLASNRWMKSWFLRARKLHDVHHQVVNDEGLMDKNFGIGFFFFDRIFGTLANSEQAFNQKGYKAALQRFMPLFKPGRGREVL